MREHTPLIFVMSRALVCGCSGPPSDASAGCRRPRAREVRLGVFFTDVADSTALGERLDAELLRRVMWRYFDVVQNVLERHGGTVEKFVGDAVMAVFGVPVVQASSRRSCAPGNTQSRRAVSVGRSRRTRCS